MSRAGDAFDIANRRVWVAGHTGMVGSAILRRLASEPVGELITVGSAEVDLTRQAETEAFVSATRPDLIFMAAARVGGIEANRSAQGQFLYENLMMGANVLEAARSAGVARVVVLGSSCIYPRLAEQPIAESQLLTGPLEPTNEGYAVAKIATLEMGKMYRRQYGLDVVSLMPANMYGPNDNYDLETSHVLPALLRKIHDAQQNGSDSVVLWGTGTPRREFLYADDLADAAIFAAQRYDGEGHLNVGTGRDISIIELAGMIAEVVGWEGRFDFDPSRPDGTPHKVLDVSQLEHLGWRASTPLRRGIELTYASFLETMG